MHSSPAAFSEFRELMTTKGDIVGDEVKYALYWATRVATNLSAATKYDTIRRKLQVIIWQSFRVISAEESAVDVRGAQELALWLTNNTRKLPEKQMVDGRQFVEAIDKLIDLVAKSAG